MSSSYGTDAGVSALRASYKCARGLISTQSKEESDATIVKRVCELPEVRTATIVLAYVSHAYEPDTKEIIVQLLSSGKRVAVPRIDTDAYGEKLVFCEITSLEELIPSAHHMLEARKDAPIICAAEMVGSVCLVPGLVFDASGIRVSESAHFDRFLAFYPGEKIGLARTTQLSSNPLPYTSGVIAVDAIVTDTIVWRCH